VSLGHTLKEMKKEQKLEDITSRETSTASDERIYQVSLQENITSRETSE
jgi:hypothetical protein